VSVEPDAKDRAGDRVLRCGASSSRCAQRVTPELVAIALFLAMAKPSRADSAFSCSTRDQQHSTSSTRAIAELLADGFSEWQLIVLTHDQQFFEHLSRARVLRKLEFTSWSYAAGPRTTQYETTGILRMPGTTRKRDVHARPPRRVARSKNCCRRCARRLAPLRSARPGERQAGDRDCSGSASYAKERAKLLLESVEPSSRTRGGRRANANVAVHGSAAAPERRSGAALERIAAAGREVSCPSAGLRLAPWNPEAGRCKCGLSSFRPVASRVAEKPAT